MLVTARKHGGLGLWSKGRPMSGVCALRTHQTAGRVVAQEIAHCAAGLERERAVVAEGDGALGERCGV